MSAVESGIREVVRDLPVGLPQTDVDRVVDLNNAGEPGVALEILCTQLYEYDITVPTSVFARIANLAEMMNLNPDVWADLRRD